jgi:hypothetical protein
MSKQVKDKSPKKMSRARIRPDDDDILEKLRVKRSVSIPVFDIEDEEEEIEVKSEQSVTEAAKNVKPSNVESSTIKAEVKTSNQTPKPAKARIEEQVIPEASAPKIDPVSANIATRQELLNSAPKPAHRPGSPKLFISGRLPRKKGTSSRSLQLLHSIEEDMKQLCTGGDLVVLNYLIKLGLEKVKESQEIIIIDSETI